VGFDAVGAVLSIKVNCERDDGEEDEAEDDGGGIEPVKKFVEAAGESAVVDAAVDRGGVRGGGEEQAKGGDVSQCWRAVCERRKHV
jgi:hypothetical protein